MEYLRSSIMASFKVFYALLYPSQIQRRGCRRSNNAVASYQENYALKVSALPTALWTPLKDYIFNRIAIMP
jgi:hypothetical protein